MNRTIKRSGNNGPLTSADHDFNMGLVDQALESIENINFEGVKVYETLAEAQAVSPTPADYTGFSVDPNTDPNNAGQYYYLASEQDGTKFYRPFPLNVNDITYSSKRVSKNLFDKTQVLENSRLNNSTGQPFTSTGWKAITNVEIDNDQLGIYVQGRGSLKNLFPFDENDNLLSPVYGSTSYAQGPVNGFYALPNGTKYINLDLETSAESLDLDLIQIEHSLTPTAVVPYEVQTNTTQVGDGNIDTVELGTSVSFGKNLFNPLTYLLGTSMSNVAYPSGGGVLTKDADSACTRLIPCEPLTDYYISGRLSNIKGFGFYNSNGDILPPVQGSTYWAGVANGVYTSPVDAVAMRAQIAFSGNGDPTVVQIEKGNVQTSFEPYIETEQLETINGLQLPGSEESLENSKEYIGQAVKKVGDVITIVSEYTDTHKTVIQLKRHLKNNLMLISTAYIIESTGRITAADFDAQSAYMMIDANATDVISPYMLNDGFGDSAAPFISGNHGVGNTPTAALLDYKVLADGIEVSDNVITECKELQVLTKSEVYSFSGQALSTPAEDVVFDEYHTYTISGNTIAVNVGLDVKQTIEMLICYGIQGTPFLSDINNIYVSNSSDKTITPYVTQTARNFGAVSSFPNIDRATFLSDTHNHCVSHWIDKSVGLAVSPQLRAGFPWGFFETASSGKVYFNLINLDAGSGAVYSAGDFVEYRGGFNLFENNVNNADEIVAVRKDRGNDLIVVDIATDQTTARKTLVNVPKLTDRKVELTESSASVTSNSQFVDSRGVIVIDSNDNASVKLKVL